MRLRPNAVGALVLAPACVLGSSRTVLGGACPGEFAGADVGPGESVVLNPGGGFNDPLEEALVVFTVGDDAQPATIGVCEVQENLHPGALGYKALDRTLTIDVSFQQNHPDNSFLMRVSIPFDEADLPKDPGVLGAEATELVFFNQSAYVLGVSGNTINSPGFGEAVGDRFTVVGPEPPTTFSDEVGDYGLFYDPDQLRGFVWANVDHATDFAAGAPVCFSDIDGSGVIDVLDLLVILGAFGTTCGDPPIGCEGDIFFDGVVDMRDLAQLIAFFDEAGCFLPPDVASINHSVDRVDNTAGNAEWGPGSAGNTHLTWDLKVAVDPDDIDDSWTTSELVARIDDSSYQAVTFYQHPNDELWEESGSQPGGAPTMTFCGLFAAAEFDSFYIEATDAEPCELADALNPPGAFSSATFVETDEELRASWFDQDNSDPFDRPMSGELPFRIARFTILVDVDDADCPDCHLNLRIIPSDSPSPDPILGTIEGLTTHRFGLSNLIPFSFDFIDLCGADIDDDGEVGIVDLLVLLPLWGDTGFGTPADIDRDGVVGIVDLLLLLSSWGVCPDA